METKLFISAEDVIVLKRYVNDDAILSLDAIISLLNTHSLNDAANIVAYLAGTFKFLCEEGSVQGVIDTWKKIIETTRAHGNIRDNQDR